mgnify:CR=1 FL=1
MALKVETTIRNMDDFSREGWIAELGDGEDYDILVGLEEDEIPVEVVSKETDGYFNVITPSGREITGLSFHHLDGFTFDGVFCD